MGLRTQLTEEARKLGLEAAFAKPFCALAPDPATPAINAFMEKAHFGDPRIEIVAQDSRPGKETILAANVVRSAPCGTTWYVAKKMAGLETDLAGPPGEDLGGPPRLPLHRQHGPGPGTQGHHSPQGRIHHKRGGGGRGKEGESVGAEGLGDLLGINDGERTGPSMKARNHICG